MAINKKRTLGVKPDEAGVKDAIHVAIVSVVAGAALQAGQGFELNEHRHAVPARGRNKKTLTGVVDPFGDALISRGEVFWGLINPDHVERVEHHWNTEVDFSAPSVPVQQNSTIKHCAYQIGVKYEELMAACSSYIKTGRPANYPGTLSEETVEGIVEREIYLSDVWSEWADEAGYEFENNGSSCCPEYDYPDCLPFEWV
jgi:hypothetical protein